MIEYRKGSLFEAPKGSYLVHACNTQGVWGSGIAVEFKKRFPGAFAHYNRHCQNPLDLVIGQCWCMHETDHMITCLMVSTGYGRNVSPKEEILKNTRTSVTQLLSALAAEKKQYPDRKEAVVCSNKFNSGFFRVPWEETEAVLLELLNTYNIKWIVYDPDLKT